MGETIKQKSTIALDTNVFIYYFEENKRFFNKTAKIFKFVEQGEYRAVSSVITMIEILTFPKKHGDYLLVKEYSEALANFPNLEFVNVDWEIADLSSSIRAKYGLTTPDAIQIASALVKEAKYFLTADKVFKKIKEIKIKLLQDKD